MHLLSMQPNVALCGRKTLIKLQTPIRSNRIRRSSVHIPGVTSEAWATSIASFINGKEAQFAFTPIGPVMSADH